MSYKSGMNALNLKMTDRVPRTEYSAENHWPLVKAVTGIDTEIEVPVAECSYTACMCNADNVRLSRQAETPCPTARRAFRRSWRASPLRSWWGGRCLDIRQFRKVVSQGQSIQVPIFRIARRSRKGTPKIFRRTRSRFPLRPSPSDKITACRSLWQRHRNTV